MLSEQSSSQPRKKGFWEGHFIVNHEFQFIYCPIPKNASSSLKALCLLLEKEHDHEKVLQPHALHHYANTHLTLSTYSRAEAEALLNDQRYFRFCIVRNPWSRVASAYFSKFLRTPIPPFAVQVVKNVYQHHGLEPDLAQSITFRQFVEYLARTPNDPDLDVHWRPQYDFLGDIQFHFVARFETLEEDFQVIKQVAKLPLDLPWRNKTGYNDSADSAQPWTDRYPAALRTYPQLPSYQQFYTPELVELVRQRYQTDIERFEYEFI